jgi:hypothetical protein
MERCKVQYAARSSGAERYRRKTGLPALDPQKRANQPQCNFVAPQQSGPAWRPGTSLQARRCHASRQTQQGCLMSSNDAHVKAPPTQSDRETRFRDRDETPVVLDEVDARQGVTGHNVRYVLGFGLAAVIIAFAVILYFDFLHFH